MAKDAKPKKPAAKAVRRRVVEQVHDAARIVAAGMSKKQSAVEIALRVTGNQQTNRCSNCGTPGHDKNACPERKKADSKKKKETAALKKKTGSKK